MQQFTLSLKAPLASEAQALEGKFGEVLCSLLQLSPSVLLQCSHLRLPSELGKGDLAAPSSSAQGHQLSLSTHPPFGHGAELMSLC